MEMVKQYVLYTKKIVILQYILFLLMKSPPPMVSMNIRTSKVFMDIVVLSTMILMI